jgi:RNA polymerase sigma factor (sigma-70 family)
MECGEATEAWSIMDEALMAEPSIECPHAWEQLQDVGGWSDARLIEAVRCDPPSTPALDALADRYWKALFGRCQLLTLNEHRAVDLAQEAWCRVLRARHGLKPDGNFPAYLMTIATNIWRDWHRASRRAGPVSERRVASLDSAHSSEDGETITLSDVLPDLSTTRADQQRQLMLDIDQALEKLTPQLRDVLVSRYLAGESCAGIGERLGRTEQTISAWVREAIRQVRLHFGEKGRGTGNGET